MRRSSVAEPRCSNSLALSTPASSGVSSTESTARQRCIISPRSRFTPKSVTTQSGGQHEHPQTSARARRRRRARPRRLRQGGTQEGRRGAEGRRARRTAPPPGITIKIGHVGPLTGGIAHLGKDNENGARLAVEQANAAKIQIDGKEVKFVARRRGRPGRPEGRHHRRAEARRRQGRRRRRPPELRHVDPGLADLQPGRHPGDLRLGDQSRSSPSRASRPSSASSAATTSRARRSRAISPTNTKPKTVAVIDDATAYGEGIANEVEKTLKAADINVLAAREGHRQDHRLEGRSSPSSRAGTPTPCSTAAWTPPAARCSSRAASSASRRCSRSATARAPTR